MIHDIQINSAAALMFFRSNWSPVRQNGLSKKGLITSERVGGVASVTDDAYNAQVLRLIAGDRPDELPGGQQGLGG